MPRFNVELKGKWACYSTVVDDFITPFMSLRKYERWRKKQYGREIIPLSKANFMTYEEAMETMKIYSQELGDWPDEEGWR